MRLLQHALGPLLWVALALVLALGWNDGVYAQAGPTEISVEIFHEWIVEGIEAMDTAAPADKARAVRALQARMKNIEAIVLPNGQRIQPDLTFIDPQAPEDTLARLHLLDEQLTLSAHDATSTRMAILQDTLQEIKPSRPLFRFPELPQTSFIPDNKALATVLDASKWAIIFVGAALFIFLVANWLSGMMRGWVEEATLDREDGALARPLSARQAREMASTMAATGAYREAVRHLYLSLLLKLEEEGIVPRDRSKTNRELLAQATADPALRQHLRSVIETFERGWYGEWEPDAATFQAYAAEIDTLTRLLATP